MFDTFKTAFIPDEGTLQTEAPPSTISFADDQLGELLIRYGGRSFNQGLYRIIAPNAVAHWSDLVLSAFPIFTGRITCFSMDWLGRIFALDSARLDNGRPGIVMLEPGTAETLEIPCNIETFHESELIEFREEALAESFYRQWLGRGGVPPEITQCIGYKRPLFLGGADTVDNLEVADLDVYWTIAAQLIQRTRGLPQGTSIGKATID